MPRERFIFPVEEGPKEELLGELNDYSPELRDVKLSVIWPLDREEKQFLDLAARETISLEDGDIILNFLSDEDEAKKIASLNLIESSVLSGHFPEELVPQVASITERRMAELVQRWEERSSPVNHWEDHEYWALKRVLDLLKRGIPSPSEDSSTATPKVHKWLLGSRKPIFGTNFPREAAERLVKVKKVFNSIKKSEKEGEHESSWYKHHGLDGVVVVGSTTKGYVTPGSDLDFMLLTKNEDVIQEFRKQLESNRIVPCELSKQYQGDVEADRYLDSVAHLFTGVYIGDREALYRHQRTAISTITVEEWEEIRLRIAVNETLDEKAKSRLGLTQQELRKINAATLITRVPPPLEEAKKVVL